MDNDNKTIGILKPIITLICVVIVAAAVVVCTMIFTKGIVEYKNDRAGGLSATGSASVDFEADLIVWRGTYSAFAETTSEAYSRLDRDTDKIKRFLEDYGIEEDDVVFSAIDISRRYSSN